MSGKLYIIGTPIGNLGDVSKRALEILSEVEYLVCEDTRVTSKLINHYMATEEIKNKPKYMVCNDHNERETYMNVVDLVEKGAQVGLVSDAGMPTISDPGYRVVKECWERELDVEMIPGPSSVSAALALSGLGGNNYLYLGFLPTKQTKRKKLLESVKISMEMYDDLRVVLFLSRYKALKDIAIMNEVLGECEAVVLNEITKLHEKRISAKLSIIGEEVEKLKGEMVIVLKRLE